MFFTTVRDIRINYGVLHDIAGRFWRYCSALEAMRAAIESISANLQNGSGKAIDALLEMRTDLLERIDEQHTQANDLLTIFDAYLNEMRAIIHAQNDSAMMRVSRNNIAVNINSMQSAIFGMGGHGIIAMNTRSLTPLNATDEQRTRWRSNADKAHRINDFLRAQASRLIELGNELREIHRRYVIPFENKDDEFAHRANELYRTYSTGWQRFRGTAADTGNFLADLIEGMLGATEALLLGLIDLVDGMLTYVTSGIVVLFCAPFGIEPPSWASDHVSGVHNTVGTILNDPGIIFDSLVLGAVDTWEEEGIGYSVGYVGLSVATTVVTAGKIKAAKIKRLLKKGASWDELMRAGAKFDDLLRAGARFDDLVRAGAKFDDLIRAGATVDDLVRIGASLDDLITSGAKLEDLMSFLIKDSVINPGSNTATMGRFAHDQSSYHVRAGDTSHFNMGDNWNVVRDSFNLSNTDMFELFNKPFLDEIISNGQTIRFSHDPRIIGGGFLLDEWLYIQDSLNITDVNLIFEGGFWYVAR